MPTTLHHIYTCLLTMDNPPITEEFKEKQLAYNKLHAHDLLFVSNEKKPIDYKELLKKYMIHVKNMEGYTFIENNDLISSVSLIQLSFEEIDELHNISQSIK